MFPISYSAYSDRPIYSFIISVIKVEAIMMVDVGIMVVYYLEECVWYCFKEPEMKPFVLSL